jgi:hypothetical protein
MFICFELIGRATQRGPSLRITATSFLSDAFRLYRLPGSIRLVLTSSRANYLRFSTCRSGWRNTAVADGSGGDPDYRHIRTVKVLTQGASGLDFTLAVGFGGSCPTNPGQACNVSVSFLPKFPGVRFGAVLILDTNGNIMASQNISGTGVSSLSVMAPGEINTLAGDGCLSDGPCPASGNTQATQIRNQPMKEGKTSAPIAQTVENYVRGARYTASTTAKAYKASNHWKVSCWPTVKTKLTRLLMAVVACVVLAGAVVPASAQVVVKVGNHHRRHHRHYHHRR